MRLWVLDMWLFNVSRNSFQSVQLCSLIRLPPPPPVPRGGGYKHHGNPLKKDSHNIFQIPYLLHEHFNFPDPVRVFISL
jgi:hypothetical protein